MRSRGPSRRTVATSLPSVDQSLPQHYETSKKYDDEDQAKRTESKQNGRGCLNRLIKKRYKSEAQQPLCGDLANAKMGLTTSKRSFPFLLLIPTTIGLLMAAAIVYWLVLAPQGVPARPEKRFPVVVRMDGTKPAQIASISTRSFDMPILITSVTSDSPSKFNQPEPLDAEGAEIARNIDYGGLDIYFMTDNVARVIYRDDWDESGEVRDISIRDDDIDAYYAFDDDELRNPYRRYTDEDVKNGDNHCRRLAWHRYQFPNCNIFHEMNSAVNVPIYVSHGAYRDVFVHRNPLPGKDDVLIWKHSTFKVDADFTMDIYEFTRIDALISERLSSNNRIVDIYGHCALSILSEFMASGELEGATVKGEGYIKQKDLHDEDDVKPQNDLTAEDKLLIALEMAASLASLHDFPGGRIVHDDVHLSQFLYGPDGVIKLNDFNRAEIMLWDDEKGDYCRYRNNPGNGNYRSPEEYWDYPLDEKIDVYSFGNNIYALLTGLYPFYEFDEEQELSVQKKVKHGKKPYVDPRYRNRSYEEGKLVEVMEACWAYNPDQRPDLRSVVVQLQEAVDYTSLETHA